MRGQTTLPIVGVALLLVTSVGLIAVLAGQGSIQAASEPSIERATAIGISERLVEPGAGLAIRQNVVAANRTDVVDETYLRESLGVREDVEVRVSVDGRTLVGTGSTVDHTGVTVERIVWLETTHRRHRTPRVRGGVDVTLPRRVTSLALRIDPGPDATVRAVTADDQVVLANESGLVGSYQVDVSRFETTSIGLDAVGVVERGDLSLTYSVPQRRRAILAVSVDG